MHDRVSGSRIAHRSAEVGPNPGGRMGQCGRTSGQHLSFEFTKRVDEAGRATWVPGSVSYCYRLSHNL